MKVSAILCPKCKCWVYSRTRHDMRSCNCGKVSIDGGSDYVKISFDERAVNPSDILRTEFNIRANKKMLYDDWNYKTDMYGIIYPHVANRSINRRKMPNIRRLQYD